MEKFKELVSLCKASVGVTDEALLNKISSNLMLSAGVSVNDIANKYQEQERNEKAYRADIDEKILELQEQYINSINANIYKFLYKPEYGDYREYVQKVADELRRRNAC